MLRDVDGLSDVDGRDAPDDVFDRGVAEPAEFLVSEFLLTSGRAARDVDAEEGACEERACDEGACAGRSRNRIGSRSSVRLASRSLVSEVVVLRATWPARFVFVVDRVFTVPEGAEFEPG